MGTALNVESDSINLDWETKLVHPAAPTKTTNSTGKDNAQDCGMCQHIILE